MQQQMQQHSSRRKKKIRLDKLYYEIGQQKYDFFLCGLKKDKEGEIISTKWKRFSKCVFPIDFDGTADNWEDRKFFEQINQRQILPCEVVLDLEEKELLKPTIEKLKKWEWEFSAFATGSRGYHIHIFLDRELSEREKLRIIKQFGADTQKASDKCMIALEFEKSWKTGRIKELENGS